MVKIYTCLDNDDAKSYQLEDDKGEINFKGHNIKEEDAIASILSEFEEYYEEYEVKDLKIVRREEIGYTCSRYYEGQDAKDEGYGYWIEYTKEWRKGLGKATCFHITYKLEYRKEE